MKKLGTYFDSLIQQPRTFFSIAFQKGELGEIETAFIAVRVHFEFCFERRASRLPSFL